MYLKLSDEESTRSGQGFLCKVDNKEPWYVESEDCWRSQGKTLLMYMKNSLGEIGMHVFCSCEPEGPTVTVLYGVDSGKEAVLRVELSATGLSGHKVGSGH